MIQRNTRCRLNIGPRSVLQSFSIAGKRPSGGDDTVNRSNDTPHRSKLVVVEQRVTDFTGIKIVVIEEEVNRLVESDDWSV